VLTQDVVKAHSRGPEALLDGWRISVRGGKIFLTECLRVRIFINLRYAGHTTIGARTTNGRGKDPQACRSAIVPENSRPACWARRSCNQIRRGPVEGLHHRYADDVMFRRDFAAAPRRTPPVGARSQLLGGFSDLLKGVFQREFPTKDIQVFNS